MASQGPNLPSAAVNDAGVGSDSWSSLSSIYGLGSAFASGFITLTTQYAKTTGYGFSIPSGATITGIEVKFVGRVSTSSGTSGGIIQTAKIVKGGTITGTAQDTDNNILSAVSDVTVILGGSSNLWGTTWTDSDINASNFGVAISINATGGKFMDCGCNSIEITVYYTTGGGGGSSTNPILYIGN